MVIHSVKSQEDLDELLSKEQLTDGLFISTPEWMFLDINTPDKVYLMSRGTLRANIRGSRAYGMIDRAVVIATASGAIVSANTEGSFAIASVGGASAYAKACNANAYADADGAIAYATTYGADAYARVNGAIAIADANGTRSYAIADGAVAYANAEEAEAYADADGATARADVVGAKAFYAGKSIPSTQSKYASNAVQLIKEYTMIVNDIKNGDDVLEGIGKMNSHAERIYSLGCTILENE